MRSLVNCSPGTTPTLVDLSKDAEMIVEVRGGGGVVKRGMLDRLRELLKSPRRFLRPTYLGRTDPRHTYRYLGRAGTARPRRRPDAAPPRSDVMTALARPCRPSFTDRLARQKNASPHTVASYRDTLRLLLGFVAKQTGDTLPARMQIEDLDAPLIGAFLDHLEDQRANSVRSRNTRLAAIHSSLAWFAALSEANAAYLQDDYPQWTARIQNSPQGRRLRRCELLRIITALPGMP